MYDEHNPEDYVLCIDILNIFMSSKETLHALLHSVGLTVQNVSPSAR